MDTDKEYKKVKMEYDIFQPEYTVLQPEYDVQMPEVVEPLPEYTKPLCEIGNSYNEETTTVAEEIKKEKNWLKQYLVLCAIGVVMLAKLLVKEPVEHNTIEKTELDIEVVDSGTPEMEYTERLYIPELDKAYAALYDAVLSEEYDVMNSCVETYFDTILKYHGDSDYFGIGFDGEHAFALYEDPYYSSTYYSEYDFNGMVVEFWQSLSGEEYYNFRIGISDYNDKKLNGETIFVEMNYSYGLVWNGEQYVEGDLQLLTSVGYVKTNFIDGKLQKSAYVKVYNNLFVDELVWASYLSDLLKDEYDNYILSENVEVETNKWVETTGGKRLDTSVNKGCVNDIILYSMSVFQAFLDCVEE